jgi:hypothetical protein
MLADQDRLKPFFHQLPAGSANRGDAGIQCPGDLAVSPSFAGIGGVGLQQDACFRQLAGTVLAAMDQRVEPLALLIAELHDILLYGNLLRGHDSSPALSELSIQKTIAKSTTHSSSPDNSSDWLI